jgi:hypothetical protein
MYSSIELHDLDSADADLDLDLDLDDPFGDLDGDLQLDDDAAPLTLASGGGHDSLPPPPRRGRRRRARREGGGLCCCTCCPPCAHRNCKSVALVVIMICIINVVVVYYIGSWVLHKGGFLDDSEKCGSSYKAVCNLGSFGAGRVEGDVVALSITAGNPLYAAQAGNHLNTLRVHFHEELEVVQYARVEATQSDANHAVPPRQDATCTLYDKGLADGLGANGILSEVAVSAGQRRQQEGITYGRELNDMWGGQKHLLGAWIMATALAATPAIPARRAIEIVGSFALDAAPLHAAVWTALSVYPADNATAFWETAGRELCFFAGCVRGRACARVRVCVCACVRAVYCVQTAKGCGGGGGKCVCEVV